MQNNAPKFFPGTDIRTNGATPDSILVKSSTVGFSGKISKQINAKNTDNRKIMSHFLIFGHNSKDNLTKYLSELNHE